MYHLRVCSGPVLLLSHTAESAQDSRNTEKQIAKTCLNPAEALDLAGGLCICNRLGSNVVAAAFRTNHNHASIF